MRRTLLISFAVLAAISLTLTAPASAQRKKIVGEDKKVRKIEDTGTFLGIYMAELDDDARKDRDYPKSTGVLVTKVVDDSPAEKAGIEDGDIIYLFGGETVEGSKQLSEMVSSRKPGDKVKIVLYRDGEKKSIDVALAERKTSYVTIDIDDDDLERSIMVMKELGEPGKMAWIGSKGGEWSLFTNRAVLGVSIHELSDDLAPYFDVKPGDGVLVLDVHDDTPADKAGLKAGDVIVEIAGAKVSKQEDVLDALGEIEEETEVTVTVVRKGKKMDIPVLVEPGSMHTFGFVYPEYGKGLKEYKVHIPEMKAIKIQELEEEKLGQKMKELEKQLEEMRARLKELEKSD